MFFRIPRLSASVDAEVEPDEEDEKGELDGLEARPVENNWRYARRRRLEIKDSQSQFAQYSWTKSNTRMTTGRIVIWNEVVFYRKIFQTAIIGTVTVHWKDSCRRL